MTEDKELTIKMSEQVKGAMAADPELAEALRMFSANMHQAFHAVEHGQYASMEDAMEAITGDRPRKLSDEEELELNKKILQTN